VNDDVMMMMMTYLQPLVQLTSHSVLVEGFMVGG